MTAPGAGGPGVGSLPAEAAALLSAMEQWVRERAGRLPGRDAWDAEHLATGAPECTTCPLCQSVALLRQVRPEAAGHLLDAAGSLVAALRAAVPAPGTPEPGAGGAPRVQHVPVDDEQG